MPQIYERSDDHWSEAPPPDGSLPMVIGKIPPLPPKWSAPLAEAPAAGVWAEFEEIEIRCTTTICEANLHCFLLTKKMASVLSAGSCRGCGELLVSLERTGVRDLADVDATFAALQRECIRHYFWHVPFGDRALRYAVRAGRLELESRIDRRLRSRVRNINPAYDGRQTPTSRDKADALDLAMHAVAACCRKCINYWHGIPPTEPLSDRHIEYLGELMRLFLRARLPNLPDEPTKLSAGTSPIIYLAAKPAEPTAIIRDTLNRPVAS